METECIIDKKLFKTMLYIYRKHGATLETLSRKFGEEECASALNLCRNRYAIYQPGEGSPPTFDISNTSYKGSLYLSRAGNKYIETYLTDTYRWIITSVISILAIIAAILSIVF